MKAFAGLWVLVMTSVPPLHASAPAGWTAYATNGKNWDAQKYVPLSFDARSLPQVKASATAQAAEFLIRSESDKKVSSRQGTAVLSWLAPSAGSWDISLEISNPGLDVKGGDGGIILVTRQSAGDPVDTAQIERLRVLGSSSESTPVHTVHDVIRFAPGDRLNIRIDPRIDGYADQFKIVARCTPSAEEGRDIPAMGYEAFAPQPPPTKQSTGPELQTGLFWIGGDGEWANSAYAEESIRLILKYVPELAVVMVNSWADRLTRPAFYDEEKIPSIIQTFGAGYEPFLKAENAFEIDWQGRDLSEPGNGVLSGTAHAAAMPHEKTRWIYAQAIRSAIRTGYSGFGYCDMIWNWSSVRGASGYNPQSIQAFRDDLQGRDPGVVVALRGKEPATFKFADYAAYYLGAMPGPGKFGLKDWSGYQPPTAAAYRQKHGEGYSAELLLFDLLCHYEWLKFADFLGRTAQAEGGFFQCMPNPEDMANGADFFFLSGLVNVRVASEEYFRNLEILDGAYYRFGYLSQNISSPRQLGIVVEGGSGGNARPYYSPEIAYLTAYELSLATQADTLEADFWPNVRMALTQAIKNPEFLERYQSMLAYGLAFKHAREDAARRLEPEFLSVSSRRLFRPWGTTWLPWDRTLGNPHSPDGVLAERGYVFQSVGEEALAHRSQRDMPVVYSPGIATEAGWKALMEWLQAGACPAVIVAVPGIAQVVTTTFDQKPFGEVFPAFMFEEQLPEMRSGTLTDAEGKALAPDALSLHGPVYKPGRDEVLLSLGNCPVVARRMVGGKPVFLVLFDPSREENRALAGRVYEDLLRQCGLARKWEVDPGSHARVYRNGEMLVVGVTNDEARDWSQVEGKKPADAHIAYKTSGSVGVSVTVPAGKEYQWLALPSGQTATGTADADGFLHLKVEGVGGQVFYVLPAGADADAHFGTLRQRLTTFADAMTLGGLAPAP